MKTLSVLLLAAAALHAQVVELVPEAKTMAAPDWVKPGARLTYYAADASRTDTGVMAGPKRMAATGSSGHGYFEITILGSQPGAVALESRAYVHSRAEKTSPCTLHQVRGQIVTTPGAADPYWIHPAALKNLLAKPVPAGGKLLWKAIKHEHQGESRDAIHIGLTNDKNLSIWVYDLASGILLQSGAQIGRHGSMDGSDPGTKFWSSKTVTFTGFDQLTLPWLGMKVPDWAARAKEITYNGQAVIALAGQPEVPGGGFAQNYATTRVADTWVAYRLTAEQGDQKNTAVTISGTASAGGLWIPVAALTKLTKGQELCSNAATGFRVGVFYVGPDRGQDICVIRWQSPIQIIDHIYDRTTGALVRLFMHDQDLHRKISIVMSGTR